MEILKKLSVVVILSLVANLTFAQNDTQKIIDAFQKSYTLEASGNYSQALVELKNVYDENMYEMNLRMGWLSYAAGSFSQSIAFYNRAITLMPYSIEAKMGLIYPVYALGKIDQVTDIYNQILKINPNYYNALYNLGNIHYGRAEYTSALPLFKKIVDLFPFDHDALLMYAWTNYQLKKYKEAKILFNKVLMNTPTDKSALEGLELLK